jgi:dTMP kinase
MKKGAFIAVYGVNNIGKSTHCRLLKERMEREGYDVVMLKYPVYELEPTGKKLNAILRGDGKQNVSEKELQTLFARNRKEFEPQLRKFIEQGKLVLAEDYIGTGIAWGMAKGLTLEFLEDLNRGLLREDFSILMTGQRDPRATEKQHIHEQNRSLLSSVSKIFIRLAQRYHWHIVEIQKEIPDTAEVMWKTVERFIKRA